MQTPRTRRIFHVKPFVFSDESLQPGDVTIFEQSPGQYTVYLQEHENESALESIINLVPEGTRFKARGSNHARVKQNGALVWEKAVKSSTPTLLLTYSPTQN